LSKGLTFRRSTSLHAIRSPGSNRFRKSANRIRKLVSQPNAEAEVLAAWKEQANKSKQESKNSGK